MRAVLREFGISWVYSHIFKHELTIWDMIAIKKQYASLKFNEQMEILVTHLNQHLNTVHTNIVDFFYLFTTLAH